MLDATSCSPWAATPAAPMSSCTCWTRASQTPPSHNQGSETPVIAAVRECLTDVRVAAGVDLGRWYRSNKATLDADALALVESAGILRLVGERKRVAQAVGAALGSLSAP